MSGSKYHLQDIKIARASLAYPTTPGHNRNTAETHGVDIVLGGHDHQSVVSLLLEKCPETGV